MFKYLMPLFVFFGIVILFIFGLNNDPRLVPSPFIDKPLPQFTLPILGQPEAVAGVEEFKGEVSLLNIWATWCIPCRQEHPLLVNLANNKDINIVGLNYKDNDNEALKWLNDLGNPYDLVLSDVKGTTGIDLGVYGVPETFVLDKNGIVKYKHVGPLTEELINDIILPIIDELNQI
jgi:cytochrome c biogenesis protein CcmG/thiol:disulfide interchange protein DsbE